MNNKKKLEKILKNGIKVRFIKIIIHVKEEKRFGEQKKKGEKGGWGHVDGTWSPLQLSALFPPLSPKPQKPSRHRPKGQQPAAVNRLKQPFLKSPNSPAKFFGLALQTG